MIQTAVYIGGPGLPVKELRAMRLMDEAYVGRSKAVQTLDFHCLFLVWFKLKAHLYLITSFVLQICCDRPRSPLYPIL